MTGEAIDAKSARFRANSEQPGPQRASIWRNRNALRIAVVVILAYGFEVGSWVAVMQYAFEDGGVGLASIVGFVQLVIAGITAPTLSRWFARMDPFRALRLLLTAEAVGALLCAAAAGSDMAFAAVFLPAALVATLVAVLFCCVSGCLPFLAVNGTELAGHNVLVGWGQAVGSIVGPATAAIVLSTVNRPVDGLALMMTIGATALVLAVMLVPRLSPVVVDNADELMAAVSDDTLDSASQATRHRVRNEFRSNAALRGLALLTFSSYSVLGALDVLFITLASDIGWGDAGAGRLLTAYGIGGLLSIVLSPRIVGRTRLVPALCALCVLGSLPLLLIGLFLPSPTIALMLVVISGAMRITFGVVRHTLMQRSAPAGELVQVAGVFQGVIQLGFAAGTLVPLALRTTRPGFVVTGLVVPLMLAFILRSLLLLDRTANVPVTEIALLSQVPIFRGLRPASLEALARAVTHDQRRAGSVIVKQGEVGHDLFVIASGSVEVRRDDVAIAALKRSDMFGEVAVMTSRPRNATVVAVTDVSLLRVDRSDFIDYIGLHQNVRAATSVLSLARSEPAPAPLV